MRQLLNWRAGASDIYGQINDGTMQDPSHGWTRQEVADLIDPSVVGVAGDISWTLAHEAIAELLVEAVEEKEFGTVLAERIAGPLGLTGTSDIEGDAPSPPNMAIGWGLEVGLAGDPNVDLAGMRTLDGRTSSAIDTATFLWALADGELLSDESTVLVFDEDAVSFGMGFDAHDEGLGHLGDLGTRYYLSNGNVLSGYAGSLAVSPETGDIIVVLASNQDLPTGEFLHETVSAWAPEAE